jgi:hypothetical protein
MAKEGDVVVPQLVMGLPLTQNVRVSSTTAVTWMALAVERAAPPESIQGPGLSEVLLPAVPVL